MANDDGDAAQNPAKRQQIDGSGKGYQIDARTIGHVGDVYNAAPLPKGAIADEQPPPVEYWQKRKPEQTALLAMVADRGVRVVGITGAGGFGKSALAARMFRAGKQFGRRLGLSQVLWVNFQSAPLFARVARNLCDRLGERVADTASEADLASALLNALGQQRVVVVFDNLETVQRSVDWQPYEAFFKQWVAANSRSTIVYTSQERLAIEHQRHQWLEPLDRLTTGQGVALLRARGILGEEGALQAFVELASGQPLLINLAAGWLLNRAQYDREVPEVGRLQALVETDDVNLFRTIVYEHRGDLQASLGKVFDQSVQALTPKLQQLLRWVSVYRPEFAFDETAAQAMLPEETVSETDLRGLARCSLLLEDKPEGVWRFQFQPLLRRFVQLGATDLQSAQERAVAYFMPQRGLLQTGDRLQERAAVFAYVQAFHHWCDLGRYGVAFASIWFETESQADCDEFLKHRGHNDLRREMLERLWEEWQPEEEERTLYGKALLTLGQVWYLLDRRTDALELYQQTLLPLMQVIGDRLGEANTLQAIGDVLQFLKQSREAVERYDEALGIYRQVGARLGEANTLQAIGDVLQFLKQSREAVERYDEALGIYRQVGARLGEANTLKAIGDVQTDPKLAMEQFLQPALQIYQTIEDVYSQARILTVSIAPTYLKLKHAYQAKLSYEQALNFWSQIGYEPGIQHCQNALRNINQAPQYESAPVAPPLHDDPPALPDWYEKSLPTAPRPVARRATRRHFPWWGWFLVGVAIVVAIAWWLKG
jgi:tetratricopeptide (TPR) repeat protein